MNFEDELNNIEAASYYANIDNKILKIKEIKDLADNFDLYNDEVLIKFQEDKVFGKIVKELLKLRTEHRNNVIALKEKAKKQVIIEIKKILN